MEGAISINDVASIFEEEKESFVQNLLRLIKSVPRAKDTAEKGKKKELRQINAKFKDYLTKNQDIIVEVLSDILLAYAYDGFLPANNLKELSKKLDDCIKKTGITKENYALINEAGKIFKSMSLKEQVEFIYEGLEESLKNIKDIKNRIAYSEDNFVLMNYLTVIENILSNLTAEIKYADKNDKSILYTVNNLMPVIIYLSIMLVSYFKKKIDLETLERFLIKIEMDIYRLGYTEFVTFYGIKE